MIPNRTTRRRLLAAAGGAAAGLAGCAGQQPDSSDDSPDSEPESGSDPDSSEADDSESQAEGGDDTENAHDDVQVVEMITDNEGMYFQPKGLLVEPGATVRFVIASGSHSTTAYHPDNGDQPLRIPEAADPWDSGIVEESDDPFEVTFAVEGVYDYYCQPHEIMGQVGRIVVGEPQDGPGTTSPDGLPPGARDELPAIETIIEDGAIDGP